MRNKKEIINNFEKVVSNPRNSKLTRLNSDLLYRSRQLLPENNDVMPKKCNYISKDI